MAPVKVIVTQIKARFIVVKETAGRTVARLDVQGLRGVEFRIAVVPLGQGHPGPSGPRVGIAPVQPGGLAEGHGRAVQVLALEERPADAIVGFGLHLVPDRIDPFEGLGLLQELGEEGDGILIIPGIVVPPVNLQPLLQPVLALLDLTWSQTCPPAAGDQQGRAQTQDRYFYSRLHIATSASYFNKVIRRTRAMSPTSRR